MNVDTLVFLRNSIEKMDISKHIEILKILKKHDIEYSENNNGIFVNLTDISDDIIKEIQTYIKYLDTQEKYIAEDEDLKKEYEKLLQ